MPELEVRLRGESVGHLVATTSTRWSFIPSETEIAREHPAQGVISLLHPISERPMEHPSLRAWCLNLLPEPEVIRPLCRRLGISTGNEFAVLAANGEDCPGAISFYPPGATPSDGELRPLTDEELRHLIAALPERPLLVDVEGARYLLPGARHKIPVSVQDGRIALALGGLGTTHVLKPGDGELKELALNEWFCMTLASLLKLSVAPVSLHQAYSAALLVERIDRKTLADGSVERIHMEDFCQLSGLESMCKFEREGGVTTQDCAEIIRRYSVAPGIDLREFIKWIIVGFLIGFGGGHGKQLVILHTAKGPRLGPFFGMWCTHIYPQMNERLAMSIGREDRPDWLIAARWKDFAKHLGIRPRYVLELLGTFASALPTLMNKVLETLDPALRNSKTLSNIQTLISKRCRQATVSVSAESI